MSTHFYKQSRPRPDGTVGYSGYDHADTIDDVVIAYKRCRTSKHFILTDDSPDLAKIRCTCGALLSEPDPDGKVGAKAGNRCQYTKRSGKVFVLGQHYVCSWGTLLTALGTSSTLAEAGRKLQVAEVGGWRQVA
jgi:hypothetical protein